ncbi:MAG: glucose-1-phosphate thymidylyltransferase [Nitrospinota bacterium]
MTGVGDYFPYLEKFRHRGLFQGVRHVWEAVGKIEAYIESFMEKLSREPSHESSQQELSLHKGMASSQGLLIARHDLLLRELSIFIAEGATIEPGVVIKRGAIIGGGAELRQGAYLRGNAIIGEGAVVGHATEVKNSLFFDHAEAGHFAYVGDSLLGYHVNVGAGTKLANLQLRTRAMKEGETIPTIKVPFGGKRLDTGLVKLGAVLGDYVEIGCNTVTAPGTLVGPGSWVYACMSVPKGVYPPDSILRPGERGIETLPREERR